MKNLIALTISSIAVIFLGHTMVLNASNKLLTPDYQAKYDSALAKVELADQKIEQTQLMIKDGKQQLKESSTESKRLNKELKSITKRFNKEYKRLEKQLKSKDKEVKADAKSQIQELKTTNKAEMKEIKDAIKANNKQQTEAKKLISRGETKLYAAKEAKKRAVEKLKLAEKNLSKISAE